MAEDNSLTCETDAPEGVSNKVSLKTHINILTVNNGEFSASAMGSHRRILGRNPGNSAIDLHT